MRRLILVLALALSVMVAPAVASACCPPDPPSPILWDNGDLVNAQTFPDDNDLEKVVHTWAWDSAAYSSSDQVLRGRGWIEFTVVGEQGLQRAFGLNQSNDNLCPGDMDFGVLLWADGRIWICEHCTLDACPIEGGTNAMRRDHYLPGDRIRIQVEDAEGSQDHVVKYYLIRDNVYPEPGKVIHTSEVVPDDLFPLHVDAALGNKDSAIENALICAFD